MVTNTKLGLESLLEKLPELSVNERSLIERAYHKAEDAHKGQRRSSGEAYFTHCLEVGRILAEMKLDADTIAAALLHDVLEDTEVTHEELTGEFNESVVAMVDGVTKLKHLPIAENGNRRKRNADRGLESIRKMLLAMDNDVRVVLVKLADRLHNMRTLGYLELEKQRLKAQETMDIYAPLANRLGIWQIKWELEDLSLRYLEPQAYKMIARSLDARQADREAYMAEVIEQLQTELRAQKITAHLSGRPKHIYSIYRKMQRKQVPFDQIYDVRAIRVIVETKLECYQVLGVVHDLWRPIPSEFDDYIAAPKDNFYQSLHTAVVDNHGKTIEVQIRTSEMNKHAEYGIAAHWRYKEGGAAHDKVFEQRVDYFRRLLNTGSETDEEDAEEFVNNLKADVFQDRVYAFTPKGDIVDLPTGATAIDFAYYIHTEIGHRCRGARVNGKLVSLNYVLQTGDQVDILASKRGGPSLDWLNPHLGYVQTARARSKVRAWFRKQNRAKHIANGRDALERELKRLGVLDTVSYDSVAELFDYEKVEAFLVAVGAGDINSAQIANRVLQREQEARATAIEPQDGRQQKTPERIDASDGVTVMGMGGLLTTIARCCNPVPGDEVVGFITRGRGVMVHRDDCSNIRKVDEPERLVDVAWRHVVDQKQRYSAHVEILAQDREGLMRDVSAVIAAEQVNMSTINVATQRDIATFHVTIEITDASQLTRILAKIDTMPEVLEVRRRMMA